MNVLKHMEAVFVIALAAAGATGFVANAMPPAAAQAATLQFASAATPSKMSTVIVTAKRLTPAEKQRLLKLERAAVSRA